MGCIYTRPNYIKRQSDSDNFLTFWYTLVCSLHCLHLWTVGWSTVANECSNFHHLHFLVIIRTPYGPIIIQLQGPPNYQDQYHCWNHRDHHNQSDHQSFHMAKPTKSVQTPIKSHLHWSPAAPKPPHDDQRVSHIIIHHHQHHHHHHPHHDRPPVLHPGVSHWLRWVGETSHTRPSATGMEASLSLTFYLYLYSYFNIPHKIPLQPKWRHHFIHHHMYLCVCICVCVFVFVYVYLYLCIRICVFVFMHLH